MGTDVWYNIDLFIEPLGSSKEAGLDKKSIYQEQMLACLHAEFQHGQCLSDVTLRFVQCWGCFSYDYVHILY